MLAGRLAMVAFLGFVAQFIATGKVRLLADCERGFDPASCSTCADCMAKQDCAGTSRCHDRLIDGECCFYTLDCFIVTLVSPCS